MARRGMHAASEDEAIDVHIGARLAHRRHMMGLTQSALGQRVGMSYQQIQRYEGGGTISAARLHRLAASLDTHVGFFFEGLGGGEKPIVSQRLGARAGEALQLLASLPSPLALSIIAMMRAAVEAAGERKPKPRATLKWHMRNIKS